MLLPRPVEIDPVELQRMLKSGTPLLIVDVRQPWEHELVHLQGDVLVPLNELPARAGEITPDDDRPVVLYCHHGMRSLQATAVLRSMGVSQALSLRGGIDAWARQIDPKLPTY